VYIRDGCVCHAYDDRDLLAAYVCRLAMVCSFTISPLSYTIRLGYAALVHLWARIGLMD